MYYILKDFAGPVATIIASVAAAFITWKFASQQVQIAKQQARTAKQQADTALDQLRYNLLEKRYAIFKDVQDLIRLLVNRAHSDDFRPTDVIPHYIVMDEARFFFSDDTCSWLVKLKADCQSFLIAGASQNPVEAHAKMTVLVEHIPEMLNHFENELQFSQLTRRASAAVGSRLDLR